MGSVMRQTPAERAPLSRTNSPLIYSLQFLRGPSPVFARLIDHRGRQ